MTILAAMSDVGSFNTIYPVSCLLKKMNHRVVFCVNGNSKKILKEKGEVSINGENVNFTPSVFITGMSIDLFEYRLAKKLKGNCQIIVIPDQWSGPFYSSGWKEDGWVLPNVMCFNDDVGLKAIREWGFKGKVVKTGWPALDRYKKLLKRGKLARRGFCKRLNLNQNKKIILFNGQGERENTEALEEVIDVFSQFEKEAVLAVREHHNMRRDTPNESKFWDRLIKKNKGNLFNVSNHSYEELLLAADAVVSDFSTMLMEVAVLGKPAIAVLYPGKPIYDTFRSWDWAGNDFPLVTLGCCLKASRRSEIKEYLERVMIGEEFKCVRKAREVFCLDEKNAERVANVAIGLIGS